MVNNRPVGFFDSGFGGLTAVREFISLCPNEDIVYFGDTARVPYGDREAFEIEQFGRQNINLLLESDAKIIVAACGTVSATLGRKVFDKSPVPIIDVLTTASSEAIAKTKNKKIGVIATARTINSKSFETEIHKRDKSINVFSVACPKFVPLIESGRYSPDDSDVTAAVEQYLFSLKQNGVDVLILGCTHYALMSEAITNYMGEGVLVVDSGKQAAKQAAKLLKQVGKNENGQNKNLAFKVSGKPNEFVALAKTFVGFDVKDYVKKTDIENVKEFY